MVLSMLITLTQQFGVISSFAITWEEPLITMLSIVSLLMLDVELLQLSCITTLSPLSVLSSRSLCSRLVRGHVDSVPAT